MKISLKLFLCASLLTFVNVVKADIYLKPFAGATVPTDGGDISYQIGGTLGYAWNPYVSTQLTYARLIATGYGISGDQGQAEVVLGLPLPLVRPYVSGGAGIFHVSVPGNDPVDPFIVVGGGLTFLKVLFMSIDIGADYLLIRNQPDYIQPRVTLGISF